MPELRKDPIIGRWVIISTERAKRPSDFRVPKVEQKGGFCPFCPGNEERTPPEVLAYRPGPARSDGPGWTLRVVPNRFPALMIEGSLHREGDGMYDKMSGVGAHEVIIEHPEEEAAAPAVSEAPAAEGLPASEQAVPSVASVNEGAKENEHETEEEEEEDDWTPDPTAFPYGPFLALAAAEILYFTELPHLLFPF